MFRIDDMRRRLNVLSKGLLGAKDTDYHRRNTFIFGFEVGFLHKTVKDYLQTPDSQSMLQSWSNGTFNIDWQMCNAFGTFFQMTCFKSDPLSED